MLKRLILSFFLLLPALYAGALEQANHVYEFRFAPGKDMFLSGYEDNGAELKRLLALLRSHRAILPKVKIHVEGYCGSLGDESASRRTVRIRSNRVKSDLISRLGLREDNFITRNHVSGGDSVRVSVYIPPSPPKAIREASPPERIADAVPLSPREPSPCPPLLSSSGEAIVRGHINLEAGKGVQTGRDPSAGPLYNLPSTTCSPSWR